MVKRGNTASEDALKMKFGRQKNEICPSGKPYSKIGHQQKITDGL